MASQSPTNRLTKMRIISIVRSDRRLIKRIPTFVHNPGSKSSSEILAEEHLKIQQINDQLQTSI